MWDTEPAEGSLRAAQGEALVAVLAWFTAITTTATECFYAVWEGYGALTSPPIAPTVAMPQRQMQLLTGPL
ncbi:hypothetical protein FHR75_004478 [Kineococcus radiotolerans]|uniref:Uncharacterized protein n=1 Tax=Kineococcus radiotolerans TaxID=131568 RepID=A0A7W4TR95_KINRA|nr:hypothetical protein [Kineococcus radiotolerans]